MKITLFDNLEAFTRAAGDFLEAKPGINQLLLGNMVRLAAGLPPDTFLALVTQNSLPIVAALRMPPYKLVFSHFDCDETTARQAAGLLAEHLRGHDLPGMVGPAPVVEGFCDEVAMQNTRGFRFGHTMHIQELTRVIPPAPVGGELRFATASELPMLVAWNEAFQEETHAENTLSSAEVVERGFADHSLYVWDDGEPVCQLFTMRPVRHGISIGGVYTPPAARRRGYASACVAELSQQMLDSGYHYCTLFTDAANPTSNHIYHTIGYEQLYTMLEAIRA